MKWYSVQEEEETKANWLLTSLRRLPSAAGGRRFLEPARGVHPPQLRTRKRGGKARQELAAQENRNLCFAFRLPAANLIYLTLSLGTQQRQARSDERIRHTRSSATRSTEVDRVRVSNTSTVTVTVTLTHPILSH